MIRKIFILTTVALLFIYTAWNFYTEALSYAPLSSMKSGKTKLRDAAIALSSKYKSEWNKEIHEKNLFSPYRSYIPPKPVITAPVAPPPKRPELALKGIVLDTFGDYVGFIEINQARAMPMRKGDKIEDIEIVDITDRRVVVKWNAEMINLSIEKIRTINKPVTKK